MPIFYHFRGGKGVATMAGVILTCSPLTFLAVFVIFLIIVIGTRYVSLASSMAAMMYPLILYHISRMFYPPDLHIILALLTAALIVVRHVGNLKRIYLGIESKLYFDPEKKAADKARIAATKAKLGLNDEPNANQKKN
jgi:glycerol-3-phosphate acyltransferase PlsY